LKESGRLARLRFFCGATGLKRYRFIILPGILLGMAALAWASVAPQQPITLKPNMEQRFASSVATRFLTNWHYKDTRLDNRLSSGIFEGYLELLDPTRSYFLAADIAAFERYRIALDDALRHSDLTPAYEIFNVYADRVRQRVAFARELLKRPFDFTIDEYYVYDRSEEDWISSQAELDDLWRKRVKNEFLRLKLAGKEEADIVTTLDERYENLDRRISELKSEDIFQFFMNAFAQAIEPHTAYLSPRSSENFEISMKLSLEGIGALLGRQTEFTSIQSIVPGGPADRDGRLKAGDRVLAVGQGLEGKMVDVIGWRVDDVVELIRGPKDTVVRLEVLHESDSVDSPSTLIDIVRDEVKLEEQAAKSRVIEVPRDGAEPVKVGIIDLPVFYLDFNGRETDRPDYRSSTRDVRRLIEELEAQGVSGIIMDLRDNGGGSLLEATTLTGLFIDQGPVVQVRNANGRISTEQDDEPGMAWDGPLAVLVNRYSASASEIFAAAIQDYGRGLIIGETTFGKGTVQSLLDLDDYAPTDHPMGQLKITMAQFFRVNGRSTQNRGVEPDIRFPSFGEPGEYGERSLDNALPWTSIDAADYQKAGDLRQLQAVADFRFQGRLASDQEFTWLNMDIEEYNRTREDHKVSLNEAVRRQEMDRLEAKRNEREQLRSTSGPLLENGRDLAAMDPAAAEAEGDAAEDGAEEEDDRPDLLLRESARIVADMVELEGDRQLLAQQFSTLLAEDSGGKIN
jgi:carboxyl-terminal processing protease